LSVLQNQKAQNLNDDHNYPKSSKK